MSDVGENISSVEIQISGVFNKLQKTVESAVRLFSHNIIVLNTSVSSPPLLSQSNSSSSTNLISNLNDKTELNHSDFLPSTICSNLLINAKNEIISFKLALCFCSIVCLISYTKETEGKGCNLATSRICSNQFTKTTGDDGIKEEKEEETEEEKEKKKELGKGKGKEEDKAMKKEENRINNIFVKSESSGLTSDPKQMESNDQKMLINQSYFSCETDSETRPDFFKQLDPGACVPANLPLSSEYWNISPWADICLPLFSICMLNVFLLFFYSTNFPLYLLLPLHLLLPFPLIFTVSP